MRTADRVPTKQLFELAGWAIFVACIFTLVRLWHPQTYTMVQADTTPTPIGASVASGGGARQTSP